MNRYVRIAVAMALLGVVIAVLCELSLAPWLLVTGVGWAKWQAKAGADRVAPAA